MQQFFVQCVSQKNVFASCTHSVTRYNLPCNLSREKNCVRSEISYDWLTIESVAKQVGRTMSHVVLLCDLKKKIKKKTKILLHDGELHVTIMHATFNKFFARQVARKTVTCNSTFQLQGQETKHNCKMGHCLLPLSSELAFATDLHFVNAHESMNCKIFVLQWNPALCSPTLFRPEKIAQSFTEETTPSILTSHYGHLDRKTENKANISLISRRIQCKRHTLNTSCSSVYYHS